MDVIDLALEQKEDKTFDLVIEDGDLKSLNSFDTAILISILTERRANATEQPVNSLRRGWWGNVLSAIEGFEIGSKLWILKQARKTQDSLNRAKDFTFDSLNWLVEDGFLSGLDVTTNFTNDGLNININFIRSNNSVDSKNFVLWDNTGTFGQVDL